MNSFFSMVLRMKYINRWGLMRNTWSESLAEHSLDVAILAHALCIIRNKHYGGSLNPEHAAVIALFHDAGEIITGDLPTPVKYNNPQIKDAYKALEGVARENLLAHLPEDLRADYRSILDDEADRELYQVVKAADKLSALIKCIEEEKAGNNEFTKAKAAQLSALKAMQLPEVDEFLRDYIPSFELTLDEQ
ncbi:MAG: 5'-deoxynucleotidase [Oscillospiraceae bacterium]|jgi:5'-deoxynucleotidase